MLLCVCVWKVIITCKHWWYYTCLPQGSRSARKRTNTHTRFFLHRLLFQAHLRGSDAAFPLIQSYPSDPRGDNDKPTCSRCLWPPSLQGCFSYCTIPPQFNTEISSNLPTSGSELVRSPPPTHTTNFWWKMTADWRCLEKPLNATRKWRQGRL